MTSDTLNNLYPNPTIVVGVGDFGLACLEQLGESWISHKTGGGDASLRNLRLLHIRSGSEDPLEWVKAETRFGSLLERLQDTKLPAMALAWAILRSIGLIRYNTGQFEVAMLHDAGLVSREKHSTTEETHTASKSKKPKSRKEKSKELDEKAKEDGSNDDPQEDVLLRRRYFTWTKIGTDPHASAQRLEEIRQNNGAFDSFVGPIIHRVILGHSPKILTSLIARFKAMKQGFDPSPWHWLQALGEFEDKDGNPKKTVTQGSGYSTYELSENIGDTARHTHNELISENLQKSWSKKFKDYDPLRKGKDKKRLMRVPKVFQYFEYLKSCRPDAFQNYHETHDVKEADIYRDPLRTLYPSMSTVLSHDFESGKWEEEGGKIKILDVSDYILGMYDHDEVERGESFVNHLKVRIQEFGKLVEKGLMRLWVDLSLDPGWETAYASEQSRQRIHIVDCIYQSLYLLGELVVQPVLKEDLDDGFEDDWDIHKKIDTFHDDIWTDGIKLPSEPSQTLRHMELITDIAENKERRKLESRLVNVGVSLDDYDVPIRHLYRSAYYFPTDTPLDLLPNPNPNIKKTKDNASEGSENTRADYGNDLFETERGEKTGHKGVREVINEELRHLYHFVGLQSFNKGLTRQPPKLNVFLVVDLCEPLSRSVLRDLTREIAAEITRVTGAIFQIERGGLAKLISIVPIVWMPNVADPTEGKNISSQNRGRMEGSILHSLYSFRRWLSTVPSNLRCMRQMFINSRMTDNAFWGTRDAVSQTVQFMQMSLHNDLSTTPAIAPTRAIARGGNYYASFSCHQIDFPEFRAREYLATQLGRDFLASLQQPWVGESKYLQQKLTIPDEEEQHEEVSAELEEIIQPIAESISSLVPVESLTASMTNLEILQRFDMGLLDDINQAMMKEFRRVVSQGSEIERLLLAQRKEKQQELQRDLAALIRESDAFVTDGVVRIGLDLVRTGLLDRKNQAYDLLRKADENIQQTGEESFTNDIPNSKNLNGLFEQVIEAILARPAQRPMRLAFGTLLLFSFVLIGPLIWGAMKAAKLYLFPNPLELFLWKGLPVLLAALISYGAYWFLRSRYIKAHQALIAAASQLRGAVYQLIAAPRNSSPSSLFGFFDSRLKLVTSSFIRSYANSLQEQTAVDARFGNRMFRSAKKQSEILQLKMESLGVRILPSLAGKSERVVLSELFKLKNATYQNNLIQPQLLQEYYQREYGAQDSWRYHAEGLLRKLGGLQSWRDEAPLADTDKILGLGRQRFSALIHTPITELDQSFSESISDNIRDFIHKIYPNMGFGADFDGKEGSDPDGLETKIVGSIIINEDMELTLKGLLHKDHAIRTIPKMSVDIRPNSMYLLSISTGLSSLIIRNIHRYESPLENREERIDSLFPFSFEYIPTKGENEEENRNRPLTPLMGFLKETLEGAHDPEVPPDTDKEEGSS